MRPIEMLDLEAQHAPLQEELHRAAARVLRSGRFILGAEVAGFEREMQEMTQLPCAVGLSSGTDALVAMLLACGVGPGDDVVTTPFTFFATAEAIVRVGARPVFVDVDLATYNLDARAAIARLDGRTKAVLVVHLFGRMADTAAIEAACAGAGVTLLEDAAQALGARATDRANVPGTGGCGAAAALSFHPAKNLGGFGDGGMVLTRDRSLAARVRLLRSHGADEKLHHVAVGGNFRLDELQAALLRVKLRYLETWMRARHSIAATYRDHLRSVPVLLPDPFEGHAWNQFVVRVLDHRREGLRAHLRAAGITTAVYYPLPLHLQPALAPICDRAGELTNAEQLSREALALPIHPCLSTTDVEWICDSIREFFGEKG